MSLPPPPSGAPVAAPLTVMKRSTSGSGAARWQPFSAGVNHGWRAQRRSPGNPTLLIECTWPLALCVCPHLAGPVVRQPPPLPPESRQSKSSSERVVDVSRRRRTSESSANSNLLLPLTTTCILQKPTVLFQKISYLYYWKGQVFNTNIVLNVHPVYF